MAEVRATGTLALNSSACKATSARIPLSAKGLRGGAASQFEDEFDCDSPRRVLGRIRATFESSTQLRLRQGFLRTSVPLSEGAPTIRTQSGKPLMYATVSQSGKAAIFTGPTCYPD